MDITGVSYETIRLFLFHTYFGRVADAVEDEANYHEKKKYLLPLKDDYETPTVLNEFDTYIQYSIMRDRKIGQDTLNYNQNEAKKVAQILLRFVGAEAELWAKALHHIHTRKDFQANIIDDCNGTSMPQIGDILSNQVKFFGNNTRVAFDLIIHIEYTELRELDFKPLKTISMASGKIY